MIKNLTITIKKYQKRKKLTIIKQELFSLNEELERF
jgi:hypothetical protein